MKRSPEFDVSWSFDFTWDKMDKNTSKLQPSSQLLVVSARFYPPAESPGYQRMSVNLLDWCLHTSTNIFDLTFSQEKVQIPSEPVHHVEERASTLDK